MPLSSTALTDARGTCDVAIETLQNDLSHFVSTLGVDAKAVTEYNKMEKALRATEHKVEDAEKELGKLQAKRQTKEEKGDKSGFEVVERVPMTYVSAERTKEYGTQTEVPFKPDGLDGLEGVSVCVRPCNSLGAST